MKKSLGICIIKDCSISYYRNQRGYCGKHYQRFIKYGDPLFIKIQQHGLSRTYYGRVWHGIRRRTNNTKSFNYHNYGGRGITMHKPWYDNCKVFHQYIIEILGPRPTLSHSLDRINNNGNYEPGNLKWSTPLQQTKNRRPYAYWDKPNKP